MSFRGGSSFGDAALDAEDPFAESSSAAAAGEPTAIEDEENVFEHQTTNTPPSTFHPADDALSNSHTRATSDDHVPGVEGGENPFEMDSARTAEAIAALPPPPTHLTSDSWAEMFWATASNKQRLQQFMYSRSLLLTVGVQVLMIILFLIIEPTAIKYNEAFSPVMAFFLVLCQLLQLAVTILAHLGMMRELQALYVRPAKIWNMYLTTCIWFSSLYFACFCFQRASFNVDGYAADGKDDVDTTDPDETPYEDLQTSNNIPTVFVYFCYFSGAIMTSTGFGDIAPTLWYSQAITNLQMLVGTMYHVGVFGLTLSHFRTFQKVSEAQAAADLLAGRQSLILRCWARWAAIPFVRRVRNHPYTGVFKAFCLKYLVLVCIVFQALNTVLLLSIPDPFRPITSADGARYTSKVVVLTFITLFQTAMFVGVMYVSIRLVKKINNKDITAGFLIQSFLATALLFGGIYFVLFAATPSHQFSHHSALSLGVFEVLYVFVHFSFTVMTTTGFGDVYARGILARCFVLLQMLISILYSAVIIGLGTSQLIDMQAAKAESDLEAKEKEQVELRLHQVREQHRRLVEGEEEFTFDQQPDQPHDSANAHYTQHDQYAQV